MTANSYSRFVLAAALALSLPAAAQTSGLSGSIPLSPPQPGMGPGDQGGAWNNERFERQEFREEMEKIRKEHEDLERARDKLLDECVNAQGAQAAQCAQQKQALHEWAERLHERMRALHEKMAAAHSQNRDMGEPTPGQQGQFGNQSWPHANGAPPPATNNGPPADLPPAQ